MPLPAPWLAYKTQDGKEYYYNPQTKVTTWTHPSGGASKTPPKRAHQKTSSGGSGSSSAPPAGGAGRGGLLAQIQQGTRLKKVKTVEKTLFAGPTGTVGDAPAGGSSAPSGASAPEPSGGGMGAMMAAIKSGGNLRKTPGAAIQRENSNGVANGASGAGGFAEIMRKNREAAARRGGSAPPTHNSSSAPSTPRSTSYENGGSSGSVEARLAAIESKLDKIMAHLGIN